MGTITGHQQQAPNQPQAPHGLYSRIFGHQSRCLKSHYLRVGQRAIVGKKVD